MEKIAQIDRVILMLKALKNAEAKKRRELAMVIERLRRRRAAMLNSY